MNRSTPFAVLARAARCVGFPLWLRPQPERVARSRKAKEVFRLRVASNAVRPVRHVQTRAPHAHLRLRVNGGTSDRKLNNDAEVVGPGIPRVSNNRLEAEAERHAIDFGKNVPG